MMKKTTLIITMALITFISCQKEPVDKQLMKNTLKVETTLAETGLTIEDKNQTVASENEINDLKEELMRIVKYSSKTSTKANNVGVIRHGSCGSYDEIEFRMDCEDDNNASWISTQNNWNGDITMDSKGNVTFHFCVVPNNFIRFDIGDYAVLAMDINQIPWRVSLISRYFDNEDDNNINYALYSGASVNQFGDNISNVDGTLLHFFHYAKDPEYYSEFPLYNNLKEGYSVFGSVSGFSHAEIQTDDEDNNCANWSDANIYDDNTQTYNYYSQWYSSPGVFNFGLPSLSQLKVVKVQ